MAARIMHHPLAVVLSTGLAVMTFLQSGLEALPASDSVEEARADYQREDYKKALKGCSSYLEHHQSDPEAMRLRGKCYLALGDFDKAASDLESINMLPGPLEEAMANQNRLDANDKEDLDYPVWLQSLVLLYVARLNAGQGQDERAVRFCDLALLRSPIFPECLSLRAGILLSQNRLYEAEEIYRQAVSLRPRDWHMWLGYAGVLEKQIKYAQAVAVIERALVLIKTPPYQEPDLAERCELMTKTLESLRAKTDFHKSLRP